MGLICYQIWASPDEAEKVEKNDELWFRTADALWRRMTRYDEALADFPVTLYPAFSFPVLHKQCLDAVGLCIIRCIIVEAGDHEADQSRGDDHQYYRNGHVSSDDVASGSRHLLPDMESFRSIPDMVHNDPSVRSEPDALHPEQPDFHRKTALKPADRAI